MFNMPEILAPAGSKEQLIAAASCGADAVYLGGAVLNARRGADNFDDCEMEQAVEYCHVRGMKVHLALNTVVLPKEEAAARHMLQTACAIGIDAVIINDMGLAAFARKNAPEMPLHASTQMSVHNLSGVRALEELGFSRVVLAREMSRDEIAAITENTTIETEVFIHGALCMCVSGQCYMSSIIGERSGNRGMCAQPCRLPFYVAQKGLCGLSLKDLSLVEKMNDLRELGVSSVKIEGRMKRPGNRLPRCP
ncbi:MAG: peptidase U32 family protein [Hydrogenoanaerobacterium sp.]